MAGAILLDEAKTYLRIDDDEGNAVIQGLIDAAARHIETTYGVVSLAREESFIFDGFAAQIRVPRVPVDPGNISVTFLDTDGVVQNLEGVRAIERDGWVWLHPALGSRWHGRGAAVGRSEENTSELQSLMRRSYSSFFFRNRKIE